MQILTYISKKAIPVLLGAAGGYLYWHFIGCSTGSCPITSSWINSTLYGTLIGATFLLPGKKIPAQAAPAKETAADPDEMKTR